MRVFTTRVCIKRSHCSRNPTRVWTSRKAKNLASTIQFEGIFGNIDINSRNQLI